VTGKMEGSFSKGQNTQWAVVPMEEEEEEEEKEEEELYYHGLTFCSSFRATVRFLPFPARTGTNNVRP
jgi:hypothetical protein